MNLTPTGRNNYEKTKSDMQAVFTRLDHDAISRRLGIPFDDGRLCFPVAGMDIRVDTKTGLVEKYDGKTDSFEEADFSLAMTVYDLLNFTHLPVIPSGKLINMESLAAKMGAVTSPSSQGMYSSTAEKYDKDPEKLRLAFLAFGGTPVKDGDVSCELDFFFGLKLRIRFWMSDEDFPASLQFLWDENILAYMHYESIWYACGAIMHEISELFRKS